MGILMGNLPKMFMGGIGVVYTSVMLFQFWWYAQKANAKNYEYDMLRPGMTSPSQIGASGRQIEMARMYDEGQDDDLDTANETDGGDTDLSARGRRQSPRDGNGTHV